MRINLGGIVGLLVLLILGFIAFQVLKYLYIILLFALPVTLLITFFIQRKVIIDYFVNKWHRIKTHGLTGVLGVVISLVFLPFTSFLMLGQAILLKRMNINGDTTSSDSFQQNIPGDKDYVDFEDLSNSFSNQSNDITQDNNSTRKDLF